jgi:hypothetical protein
MFTKEPTQRASAHTAHETRVRFTPRPTAVRPAHCRGGAGVCQYLSQQEAQSLHLARAKASTQWQLYCLVHDIEKLAHHVINKAADVRAASPPKGLTQHCQE